MFSTENFDRWTGSAASTPPPGPTRRWQELLETYEQPPLDDGDHAELDEYVARRRAEIEADL